MRKRLLFSVSTLIICLFTFQGHAQTTYTLAISSGKWNDATTWTPNGIPGAQDSVILSAGQVQIDETDSVTVSYLTINASAEIFNLGTLKVRNRVDWTEGAIYGTGVTEIMNGGNAFLNGSGSRVLEGRLENNGKMTFYGGGLTLFALNTQLINNNEVSLRSGGVIGDGGWGEFINNGKLIKNDSIVIGEKNGTSPATELITIFTNNGTVDILNGILALEGHSTLKGSIRIAYGAVLTSSNGTHNMYAPKISGAGTFSTSGGIFEVKDSSLTFSDSLTVELSYTGQLVGNADINIAGQFHWYGGVLSDSAEVNLLSGSVCEIDSAEIKYIHGSINNYTDIFWNDGDVNFGLNGIFRNFGTLYLNADDVFGNYFGWFYNSGVIHQREGMHSTFSLVTLQNVGDIIIDPRGIFSCNSGLYNDSTGYIKGSGILEIFDSFQNNDGHISPGASPDTLHITGNFPQSSKGKTHIELGGYTPGFEYDQLIIDGEAQLAGSMEVSFLPPFTPQPGDSFVVMRFNSLSGQYDSVYCTTPFYRCRLEYQLDKVVLHVDTETAIQDEEISGRAIPEKLQLYSNYPNPFNPITTIRYAVPSARRIRIEIFNAVGRKVRTLVDKTHHPGYYSVIWDGRNDFGRHLSSGSYFYRLISGKSMISRKMLILK